jgi:VWFA-related protein
MHSRENIATVRRNFFTPGVSLMKRLLSLAVLACSATLLAQPPAQKEQPPAPIERTTPTEPPQQPENLPPPPPSPTSTLRVDTQLVLLNVSVVDHQGNPIRGLQPSDFHVVEDDVPQSVMIAEEHKADDPSARITIPPIPPGDYTNFPTAPPTDSLNILLLDAMNTGLHPQMYTYQNVIKFIRTELPPGARIAIFRLDPGGMSIIQGFTDNQDRLEAVLKDPRAWPKPRFDLGQNDVRARDAMRDLSTFLQLFPGRKNLIWFAGSFPGRSTLHENNALADALLQPSAMSGQHIVANDIAIYPINPHGLEAPAAFSAANRSIGNPLAGNISSSINNLEMDQVAQETGGKAFYNNNAIDKQIAESVRLGSNYYTLTYHPQPLRRGYHHRIHIEIGNPGAQLFYRTDYIARAPSKTTNDGILIARAVEFGAPETTQIIFRAHVAPATKQPDAGAPPAGDNPEALKAKSIRYQIDLAAIPRGITYQVSADGIRRASLLITAVAYDEDGARLNSVAQQPNIVVTPEQYDVALKRGYGFSMQLDLPEHTHAVRLAVADSTGRTGSIEVPVDMKVERKSLIAAEKAAPPPVKP